MEPTMVLERDSTKVGETCSNLEVSKVVDCSEAEKVEERVEEVKVVESPKVEKLAEQEVEFVKEVKAVEQVGGLVRH